MMLKVIDANRIAPKLYQGANPPQGSAVRRAGFDVLVLCASEHQYPAALYPGVKVIYAPMWDEASVPKEVAFPAARAVVHELRKGSRVLVCCNMGRNRSGLVTALALWCMTGRSGVECLWRVQTARPKALSNKFFALFLFHLPRYTERHVARAA